MLSPELQSIIDAALADGNITDKERAIILKRAQREGFDPDEVELLLDAELQKREQQMQQPVVPQTPQEVSNQSNYSDGNPTEILQNKIYALQQKIEHNRNEEAEVKRQNLNAEKKSGFFGFGKKKKETQDDRWAMEDSYVSERKSLMQAICDAVKNFPIPKEKEELYEFITYLKGEAISADKFYKKAFKDKFRASLEKASVLYSQDQLFKEMLKPSTKMMTLIGLCDNSNEKKEIVKSTEIPKDLDELQNFITALDSIYHPETKEHDEESHRIFSTYEFLYNVVADKLFAAREYRETLRKAQRKAEGKENSGFFKKFFK